MVVMKEAQEILEWYADAGVDICLQDEPIDRFSEVDPVPKKAAKPDVSAAVKQRLEKPTPPQRMPAPAVTVPDQGVVQSAGEAAAEAPAEESAEPAAE